MELLATLKQVFGVGSCESDSYPNTTGLFERLRKELNKPK